MQNIQNHLLGTLLLILFEALTPLNWKPLADLSILAIPAGYEVTVRKADAQPADAAVQIPVQAGIEMTFIPEMSIVIARKSEKSGKLPALPDPNPSEEH